MAAMPMLAGVGLMMVCCSSSSAMMMMGGSEDDAAATTAATTPKTPVAPTEYVYEFIVKEQTAHKKDFNIHITDIEADGVRITSDQLEMHEEPEWAKCNSKGGGYECEGDNYGINDPEPADGAAMNDLSWSAWKAGQAVVGTKLLTITMPSKVSKFTIDYFRPKYVPGWTIKENGTEVLSTSKGENKDKPEGIAVEYTIP